MTSIELRQLRRIRLGVRAVFILGIAASIAGNVLHARSHLISQAAAAWAPLALLLSVELISRVPVHRRGLSIIRIAATGIIAGIAAWVSYWHMVGVIARYGETGLTPYLLPISVDGLIVVASICLVELAGRIRDHQNNITTTPITDTTPADTTPVDHDQDADTEPAPATIAPVTEPSDPEPTNTPATEPADPAPADIPPAAPAPADTLPAVPAPLLPQARLIATAHQQATGAPITAADLASRMGTTTNTAAALLAAINTASTPAPKPARINGTAVQEALL